MPGGTRARHSTRPGRIEEPIEILRTIHSFDPCLAFAVHVTDPDGRELVQVKAL